MSHALPSPRRRLYASVRGRFEDPLVANAVVIALTTAMMAAAGALFWVVAARLATPGAVGLAGSLVSATVTLSYLSQLGLNVTAVGALHRSDRPAADVSGAVLVVSVAGLVFGGGYVLLLPLVSPKLAAVLDSPWLVAGFVLLVAGTTVNQLTDSLFLGIRRVMLNLWVNGGLMSVVKCALPFVLVSAGAAGLFGAVGIASTVAAVVGVVLILRAVPGRPSLRVSAELSGAKRFAGAGYLTSVLDLVPQLVLPLLVVNFAGATASGVYFVSFQVATFLNSVVYAIGASMYAEGEASPPRDRPRVVRKAGLVLGGTVAAGSAVLVITAPFLLQVFGPEYAGTGVTTLRVMALASLGVAANFWSAIRLRLSRDSRAMIGVQLCTTVVLIGVALAVAGGGATYVAGAWGIGQLFGGVVGYVVSRTVAPVDAARPADRCHAEGRVAEVAGRDAA